MPETDKTREILKKVRHLEVQTKRLVTNVIAGAYHSSFKGQGMDFEEVREYAVGDDVRSIDWNVTAKMDHPYIKVYREERELSLMLLVDLSASGDFGSIDESKRELAAEIASVLAFSAVRNSDKVGLILFTDRIEKYIAPKKGRQHVLRVIREILFFEPEGKGTDIPMALDHLNHILKRKAVCFLLSDFLQHHNGRLNDARRLQEDPLYRSISLTNRRHDLVCIALHDQREMELPNVGILTLEDAETGEVSEIDTSRKKTREMYAKLNKERFQSLQKGLRQCGVDTVFLSTGEPYIIPLRHFLQKRAARR